MSTQRRTVTYGKKASQHAFSNDFDRLDLASPQKSQSRLLKAPPLSPSPARRKNVEPSGDPFDVPLSDPEDEDNVYTPLAPSPTSRRPSPIKKVPKALTAPKKMPSPARLQRPQTQASVTMETNAKASTNGKRKRTPSTSNSKRPSRATTPVNNNIGAQSGRVTRASSAEPRAQGTMQTSTGRTPTTAPPRSKQVTSTGKRQTTPSAPPRSKVAVAVPRLPHAIAETIEEIDEDVFDVPVLDEKPASPAKSRPSKRQKTTSPNTPLSDTLKSPQSQGATPKSRTATPKGGKLITTPRQAKLWSNLLDDDDVVPSRMSATKRKAETELPKAGNKAPRVRLIDSLKAAESPSSDGDYSDDDAGEAHQIAQPRPNSKASATVVEEPSSQDNMPKQSSIGEPSASQTHGPRITYAQQRSYLQDDPQTLDELLSQPLDWDETPVATKKQIWPTTQDMDEDEDDVETGGMKTIHELRAAGDELRFDDDMNTMLDDVSSREKIGLSAKRSALMDLTAKLNGPKLKERFVGRSLEFEVFKRCGGETDPISGSALCICLVTILSEPCDPRSARLVFEKGALSTVAHMMELTKDVRSIARDRKMNMARMAQSSVSDLVAGLTLWKDKTPKIVSPQLLGAKALELLVRRLRESGVTDPLLTQPMVSRLVEMLASGIPSISAEPFDRNSLPLIPLETALSVLESATVAPACALDATLWKPDSLATISQAVTNLVGASSKDLIDLQTLSLRLCLNLANNSPKGSAAFANKDLIGHLMGSINKGFSNLDMILKDRERQAEFDELVLALGATFNLAEMSEEVRVIMAGEQQALSAMVKTFSAARAKADQADSLEASQANVAFGYLSVLLANVSLTGEGRQAVCQSLPDNNITPLVEAIEEFIKHHKAVDRQGQSEMWTAFTGRLQGVADRLKS